MLKKVYNDEESILKYNNNNDNDNDNEEERITVTQAKNNYKVTEDDLKHIDCLYVQNPRYRRAPPMRLYRIKDLIIISEKKKENIKLLEEEMNEKLYKERLDILISKDININEITEPFYDYVLGDYLINKKTRITVTSIKRHYPSVLILKQLQQKWHQSELIPYFYKYKGGSNRAPLTIMMVISKALRISNTIMTVISNNLLAYRIASYLDTDTLTSFKLYLERFDLTVQQPADYIQNEIISSLSNPSLANDDIVKWYIKGAVNCPNLLSFTINSIEWYAANNSEDARRIAITNALKDYSLDKYVDYISDDEDDEDNDSDDDNNNNADEGKLSSVQASNCLSFIMTGHPSLSEVVAIARINEYLFNFPSGKLVYRMNIDKFTQNLYRFMNSGLSVIKATEKLLAKKPSQPRKKRSREYFPSFGHHFHHFDHLENYDSDNDVFY